MLIVGVHGDFVSESLDRPVEDEVVFELALIMKLTEEPTKVSIVWSFVKVQVATVCHVSRHFFWIAQAERIDWSVDLALFDLLVLVVLVPSSQTLPGKFTFEHVKQDIAGSFQVISAALLNTEMCRS